MANTTPNLGLTIIPVGGDTNTWGPFINANSSKIDSGTYSTNNPVTPAGLNINAPLTFQNFPAVNVKYIGFTGNTPLSTGFVGLQADSPNGNGWWTDGAGRQILLTINGGINVASAGGFNGDYTASGSTANATYSAAETLFSFFAAVGKPAGLLCGPITIGQLDVLDPNYITIQSPNSLAGAYNITLPAQTPAQTTLVLMGTDGTLTVPINPSIPGTFTAGVISQPSGTIQSKGLQVGWAAFTYSTLISTNGSGDFAYYTQANTTSDGFATPITLTYTPKRAGNTLYVHANLVGCGITEGQNYPLVVFLIDSGAGTTQVAGNVLYNTSSNSSNIIITETLTLDYVVTVGSTAARTFTVYLGATEENQVCINGYPTFGSNPIVHQLFSTSTVGSILTVTEISQ